jgi:two-component system, response regulator
LQNWDDVEILLVEDNPSDMELALLAFERKQVTNIVHVVFDGEEALDFLLRRKKYKNRALQHKLKVIFLDLKLPKLDGLEVLKEIKKNPLTKPLPVVVLTSSSEERDIYESYQLGANSYVTKPVDFDQFLNTVGNIGFYWLTINQTPKAI